MRYGAVEVVGAEVEGGLGGGFAEHGSSIADIRVRTDQEPFFVILRSVAIERRFSSAFIDS